MNGFASVGAPGGNMPCTGSNKNGGGMKNTLPALTSIGKRATIQTALQRLNLKRYAIVIDAIAAMNTRAPILGSHS